MVDFFLRGVRVSIFGGYSPWSTKDLTNNKHVGHQFWFILDWLVSDPVLVTYQRFDKITREHSRMFYLNDELQQWFSPENIFNLKRYTVNHSGCWLVQTI